MKEEKAEDIFTGERYVPGIDDPHLEIEHYQRYLSVLPLIENKIVLDAACGEGYGAHILSSAAKKVTGIDISYDAVNRAVEKYGDTEKLSFCVGSVARLPFPDESMEVVVSFETIEHISEKLQYQFLEEIGRVLKKDGILIMSTPNKEIYSDLFDYHNEFHIKEFYKEEFRTFLESKFKFVQFYNQYFEAVSLIDKEGEQNKKIAYYKKKYQQNGKYYIAVAGNEKTIDADISHIMMNFYPEYQQRIRRILELQDEVESRNRHLKTLDTEIEQNRNCINDLEQKNKNLAVQMQCLSQKNEELKAHNAELCKQKDELRAYSEDLRIQKEEIKAYYAELKKSNEELRKNSEELRLYNEQLRAEDHKMQEYCMMLQKQSDERQEKGIQAEARAAELSLQIQQLNQTIRNKEGHIELLLEVEREYEREKHSRTYGMALRLRRFSLWLMPLDSKRRFAARIVGRAIRHPGLMIKMINPRRIKNCFTILKTEGVDSAANHYRLVEEYEKSRTVLPDQSNIDIVPVSRMEKSLADYEKLTFPKWDKPQVSIVIPVYNQFDYTYHCLQSILKNSGECTYEVIIANDCSTDLTQRIAEIAEGIVVVNNEKNLRFLLNCNHAAGYARGEYLVFLNNDTQVQEGWLIPLVTLLESDKTVGMVGAKLIYSDGYLQEAGGILWKDASAWNYGNRQNPNDSEFNYVHEADYISGAAIMIRTDLWKEIGGFDKRFVPAYCEDSDLAFEVRRHGYKVMYQPKSVVVHFEGISNGTDLTAGQKKYQVENQKKFYEKWKDELEENHFENGTNVFLARERSRNKKHILVIDHYVPQYDKDAGSKTTFMYLKMLVGKGYQITFLGDNFYQHEPYTTELQQMGILVLYGPKYAEHWKEWLLENISYFDIFYLNRPHITIKYIDIIKEHASGKIIYYGHDLHFLRIRREYELSGDKKLLEESDKWLKQELYIMKQAHMNYYPSVVESDEIHKIDVTIPVKAITAYVYEQFRKVNYDMDKRQGLLFVGGFGHGPNLDAVLWFLDKIYPEVYKRTRAPFYIVGSKAPEEITSIKTEGVIVKGFVSEEELEQLYGTCRIAIVPLRYGAGVKGKVVEALYHGIPIITTSVGAEGISGIEEIVEVHDQVEELIQAICGLYSDGNRLNEMSRRSQTYVREHFSTEAVWDVIKDDFN